MEHSMPGLVQFEELFDRTKKSFFQSSLFERIANFPMKN